MPKPQHLIGLWYLDGDDSLLKVVEELSGLKGGGQTVPKKVLGDVVWEERWSKSRNRAYYFNPQTGESVWDKPGDAVVSPGEVRASHLLVKHRDSRRPASWREDPITRTKEEALQIIKDFHEQITSGKTDLPTLAKVYSDCSSASRGGDLGPFGRGKMQKSFEDASFALQVGELSGPIESDSGIHLILRTA
ncbi:Peptidyl-prolyl cis-trans isomerase NIMA-interacting protein 1 [Blyttiomyces sp. JEL0837]|nr:Peptidyl-prolyl cis-trans isomerase NIMA-interacting protein 1 [Blyttiomyces sp. JEL0837]